MQISFMLRNFTCLCFYNVAHSVPAILTCPVSFVKPGVKVAFRRDDQFTGLGGAGGMQAQAQTLNYFAFLSMMFRIWTSIGCTVAKAWVASYSPEL